MKPARRLWLMVLSLPGFLAAVGAVNFVVDPYGAWPATLIDRVYLNNKGCERVMTAYRLRTELPTTLLIGSSRVAWGIPIEQGSRDGFFNASLPGASLDELATIVRVALRNPQLRNLIWGVDFFSFDEAWPDRDPLLRVRLERNLRLMISETLLSTDALAASGKLLVRAAGGRTQLPATAAARLPWPQATVAQGLAASPDIQGGSDAAQRQLTGILPTYANYRLSPEHTALFRDTVSRARAAGIEVIVFVGPMSAQELDAIRNGGQWDTFQEWKRQLVAAQPYWDFSGYGELASTNHLFKDPAHYSPGVGHLILRHLLGQDTTQCGPMSRMVLDNGAWVDATSIEAHLARQATQRLAYVQRLSGDHEMAEAEPQ